MATSTDPNVLLQESAQFCCVPKGLHSSLHTSLLSEISGLNLSLQQLIDASCNYCWIPVGMQKEVQNMMLESIMTGLDNSPNILYCQSATVNDWQQRVLDNGGALVSQQTITALCQFLAALESAGLTSKMVSVNCMVPDNLIACTTPLIVGPGNDPWTNNGPFVAGDLTVNGLIGNASSKYFDTGVLPSAAWASIADCGFTIYNMTNGGAGDSWREIGCQNAGVTSACYLLARLSGSSYFRAYDATSRVIVANADCTGFISGNRIANNDSAIYIGRSTLTPNFQTLGTNANITGGVLPPHTIFAFANSNAGALLEPTGRRLSFLAIHKGLTITEASNFYSAIQTMRKSFGGGYV